MSKTSEKSRQKMTLFNNENNGLEFEISDKKKLEEVDKKNKLNDLTNKEWMILTKSVWISKPGPRDELKFQHPATFAESDIKKLLLFFTKEKQKVMDPFVGSGSTLIACQDTNRRGYGIELIPKWAEITKARLNKSQLELKLFNQGNSNIKQELFIGDARKGLKRFEDDFFQFIVTSPPYWKILQKDKDHKAKKERISKGVETKYSELKDDLGNTKTYKAFLDKLQKIFLECYRVLENKKYMAVIVTDFKHKAKYYSFHSDISDTITEAGFSSEGVIILIQDNKNLYPYGIPYAFVPNINHQYILIFRK